MLTIGITAIGSGVGQVILDSLRDSSLKARVVGFEASPWAKGAYECDIAYRLPHADHPDYTTTLNALCQEAGVDLLFPGSDTELLVLAEAAPVLESNGCRVVVSSPECVRICRDKMALYDYLKQAGVPFATTWSLEEALAQVDDLPYPLVVKPRMGSGSVGVHIVSQPSDWKRFPLEGDLIVQQHLFPAAWYDCPHGITPYVEQLAKAGLPLQYDEISIQVMVSKNGELLGRFAGLIRLKSGVLMQLDPIDDELAWEAAQKFVTAVIPLGLKGPCLLQSRKTRSGIVFYEANLRFAGGCRVRALMGYNAVEAAVRHFLLGQDDHTVRRCLRTRTDKVGLRQMTEIAVPRRYVDRLERDHKLEDRSPFQCALITESTSQLGSWMCRTLLEANLVKKVIAPVRDYRRARELWDGSPLLGQVRLKSWEMPEVVPDLDEVDLVIHATAERPIPPTDDGAWHGINVVGTLAIVNALRAHRAPFLIFISSQSVYGTQRPPLWSEDDMLCPDTPYDYSKAAGEAIVQTLEGSSTRWAILRLASLYGLSPGICWDQIVHRFAALTARGGAVTICGDGRQRVDLLHIHDAVDAAVRLVQRAPDAWNEVYNVGSGRPVSTNELAEACIGIARTEGWPIPDIHYEARRYPGQESGMSIERIEKALGWTPKVCLTEGLAELIRYARQKQT